MFVSDLVEKSKISVRKRIVACVFSFRCECFEAGGVNIVKVV